MNPNTLALDNISVIIQPGTITGLVGPDGAGKTTLMRLMTGLMKPTQGKIKICGIDTQSQDPLLYENLGYMPQKFGLYEDLTVIENLKLFAELRQLTLAEEKKSFKKMLNFTKLSPFIHRYVGDLSGGMKQKLGLACALLKEPRLLLLDEPTVGVDPISRLELWEIVIEIAKQNICVIWATSYLDEAQRCSQVLLLNEGKLLFNGPPDELTKTVKNQIYLVQVNDKNKRELLSSLLPLKGVIDGEIEGEHVRLMLNDEHDLPSELTLTHTTPRFEDAFINILGGKYIRESLLATHIHGQTDKKDVIAAKNLTKYYGDFRATHQINFSIKRGEIFGLLGPNGAGKSTIFKMLCGLVQPTEGKALISGHDLRTSSAKARNRLGYMAQKFSLYGNLTVQQNLDFFSGIYGLKGKHRKTRIKQMFEFFELEHYQNVNADKLPLGFKQRLALACALMHEPDVLFLDEPTSGVDPLTRREFWVHINGMVQKGITIMVTTHQMDEAEYCDRVALIYQGENIAMDTPDALKNKIKTPTHPDPTLEETFIELIKRYDKAQVS